MCHQEDARKSGRKRTEWTCQLLVYADKVKRMGKNMNNIKKNRKALLEARREVGLETNAEKTKYTVVSSAKCRTIS